MARCTCCIIRKCTDIAWCAGIEDLREKREEVNRQILQQEEEKAKIQKVCERDRERERERESES